MNQEEYDNGDSQRKSSHARRKFQVGWGRKFGIQLTGLSQRDVSRIAVAIAFAIVAIALTSIVFAFTLVWDRVSTLWQ